MHAISRLVLLGVICQILTCSDSPTSPQPTKVYNIYAYIPGQTKNCLVFSMPSNTVDSFALPSEPYYGLEASADGKALFLATVSGVERYDLATKAITRMYPCTEINSIDASPSGSVLAVIALNRLVILSLPDLLPIFEDSVSIDRARFSPDGSWFAGSFVTDTVYFLTLDSTFTADRRYIPFAAGTLPQPMNDKRTVFLYYAYLYCYDYALDSVLEESRVWSGFADMELSPNGRSLLLTGPGEFDLEANPAPYSFVPYSVPSMNLRDSIRISSECDTRGYLPLGEIEITPDGKWLIGIEPNVGFTFFGWHLLAYDLTGRDSTRQICLRVGKKYLTCQSQR